MKFKKRNTEERLELELKKFLLDFNKQMDRLYKKLRTRNKIKW